MMFEQDLKGEYLAISKIQEDEQNKILVMDNVVGVAVSHKIKKEQDTGDPCLTVFVEQKLDRSLLGSAQTIPKTIKKYKTDVVETGPIFAEPHIAEDLVEDEEPDVGIQTLRGRIRPVEGGYSVGHYQITAGTMATAVYDRSPFPGIPRRYYMLSNNHVLANSNNARVGDPILQPGPHDGGTYPRDMVARLYRFVPIRFDGSCNYVDAAIAVGEFHDLDREVYWIGYVKGVATVGVNTIVQKTGRTTSYTTGRVTAINATVNVNYGGGRVGRMCRQIVTTNMSAGGDSGSLLCDMNENAVGLLFAGSSSVTIHNDIRYVQALLGIRVV
jgi:S1-C subfamily serine protease